MHAYILSSIQQAGKELLVSSMWFGYLCLEAEA